MMQVYDDIFLTDYHVCLSYASTLQAKLPT